MTDIMTSQNIDHSSWDILYNCTNDARPHKRQILNVFGSCF